MPLTRRNLGRIASVAINLLIPGSGLILAAREWFGLLLSVLFGMTAQVALAGLAIAPLAVPRWLTFSACAVAGVVWTVAQVEMWRVLARAQPPRQSEVEA